MATPARQSDNQWVLGERRRDRSSKRKRGESITQASITRFVSPRAVSRRCISAGRPRGLRPLPFGTRVGTGSTLGEPSCFVADICCSDVAQEGMGGRSRTRSQKVSKQSEEFPQAPTTFTSCIWISGGFARQKREGRSKKRETNLICRYPWPFRLEPRSPAR